MKRAYSDNEINDVADWFAGLTIDQLFFLMKSYEQMLVIEAKECGHDYVH